MSSNLWPSQPEALPSVEPPPLAWFEEEEFGVEVEVDNLEVPTLLDGLFDTYRDTSILHLAPSSQYSESSNSTGLIEATAASEYSSTAYSTSNYSSTFSPALRLDSEYNAIDVDLGQDSVSSAPLNSFGTLQFSQAPFPHVNVVNVQSDDGQNQPPVGISPDSLSAARQGLAPVVPKDPPIDAAPATQPRTGPIRKTYDCPICCRRKFNFRSLFLRNTQRFFLAILKKNMNTHIKTHDPKRERPFVCPEIGCRYPFTRSNDLKKHLVKVHRYQAR